MPPSTLALTTRAFRDANSGALLATVLVLLFFFATAPLVGLVSNLHPPPALEGVIRGGLLGLEFVLVSVVAILGTVVVVRRARERLPAINSALTVGAVVLLVFPVLTVSTAAVNTRNLYGAGPSELIAQRKPARDIYYLILDRYGTNSALAEAFGVQENDLPDWLEDQGFYVAPDARANYDRTGLSIPATLSLNYLDDVVAALGPESSDYQTVFDMIQDHKVGRFLKEQGYKYIHLGNWFGPMSHVGIADQNLRPGGLSEFEATLYDETALSALGALVTLQAPIPVIELLQYDSARYQFATLNELADQPGPKFVFTHVLLPHDPFVFQEDGSFYASAERGDLSEDGRFQAQLTYLNGQVEQLVTHLLDRPESERPIVVIQADEGPQPLRFREARKTFDWTTATDEEIQAKFGILDAFYLRRTTTCRQTSLSPTRRSRRSTRSGCYLIATSARIWASCRIARTWLTLPVTPSTRSMSRTNWSPEIAGELFLGRCPVPLGVATLMSGYRHPRAVAVDVIDHRRS